MGGIVSDYVLAFKIVAMMFVYYWVKDRIPHRGLATVVFLVAAYYVFFMEWGLFSIILFFFGLVMFTGVVGFVGDMVFQYQMAQDLSAMQMTREVEHAYPLPFMGGRK